MGSDCDWIVSGSVGASGSRGSNKVVTLKRGSTNNGVTLSSRNDGQDDGVSDATISPDTIGVSKGL